MLPEQRHLNGEEACCVGVEQIGRGSTEPQVFLIRWTRLVGNWESMERRRLSWKDIWRTDTSQNRFLCPATYDILFLTDESQTVKGRIHNVYCSHI